LTIGDVSPQKRQALEDEEFIERLNKVGIYAGIVDFTGWFEVNVPEEGTFNVLIVSGSIAAGQDDQDAEALRQIGKYFYLPERSLLQRNKFQWSQMQLTRSSARIETEFHGTALQ
ncbi:MAG: hypothetical protein Q4G03_06795, partial [Planctomycetia bacterium]|nr:hypothetical protein [Planctomycetia bacterium]